MANKQPPFSAKDAAEDDQFRANTIKLVGEAKYYIIFGLDKNGIITKMLNVSDTTQVVHLIGAMEVELANLKFQLQDEGFELREPEDEE